MVLLVFVTIYPVYYVLIASLSSGNAVSMGKVIFTVKDFTFEAYRQIFKTKNLLTSYGNTIFYSVFGTLASMIFTTMAAFALSVRDLPFKKSLTLLFVFVFLTQVNDVAQYFWSRAFPRHKIAPYVNSSKTTEGALLGALTTALVAVALIYFTPFTNWRQAALAGVIISAMGFAGNMTMSAIKRDQGVGDYGELVDGHSGVLDRIDSLCFAAPVFYHYVRLCLD